MLVGYHVYMIWWKYWSYLFLLKTIGVPNFWRKTIIFVQNYNVFIKHKKKTKMILQLFFFFEQRINMMEVLVILYHVGGILCVHDLMKIFVIPIFFENTRCFKHLRKIFENHHLEICMAKKIPTFFLKQDFYLYGQ